MTPGERATLQAAHAIALRLLVTELMARTFPDEKSVLAFGDEMRLRIAALTLPMKHADLAKREISEVIAGTCEVARRSIAARTRRRR